MCAAILRQSLSGGDPQFGRKILDQDGHGVRPQQDPQQCVSKPRAAFKVAGKVAGIDIGHAGHKRRTKIAPHLATLERGKKPESKFFGRFWKLGRQHKSIPV